MGKMKLKLAKLQKLDDEARKLIRAEGLNKYKEFNGVLYYQRLLFVPEII